ncbi:hypothetical protein CQ022_06985 [Chryseobacterium culicis]|uniref:Uncharacterized protein n=1 Tax=Chryseobacterium culicis TaxID=680127 RepID=A0A2S9CZN9_CHRCI|nr:hypothetical protein CQ022_06985 [Chryseobacterium culicis]PRB91740.1 hypothetical protein CQ033_00655 [Chryseobacterium culicis]
MIFLEIPVSIIDFKSKIHLFLIPVKVFGPSDSVVAVSFTFKSRARYYLISKFKNQLFFILRKVFAPLYSVVAIPSFFRIINMTYLHFCVVKSSLY